MFIIQHFKVLSRLAKSQLKGSKQSRVNIDIPGADPFDSWCWRVETFQFHSYVNDCMTEEKSLDKSLL